MGPQIRERRRPAVVKELSNALYDGREVAGRVAVSAEAAPGWPTNAGGDATDDVTLPGTHL